jgi:hypothetical protein
MKRSTQQIILSGALDPDTQAYINAVELTDGQPLERNVRIGVNEFIVGCKQDGNWNAIASSCILAGARTLAGALIPLKGVAPSNVNFVASDYNRKTGLLGDGSTKYLNTNRNDNADPLNDCHISAYVSQPSSQSAGVYSYIGASKDVSFYSGRIIHLDVGGGINVFMRYGGNPAIGANTGGFIGGSRNNGVDFVGRIARASSTITRSSDTAVAIPITVFALSYGASIIRYSSPRIVFYSIGSSIDLLKLEFRVNNLVSALGAV